MTATAAAPRRSRRRRALRGLATALIVVGALLLADACVTLLWQEPVSSLYAHNRQGRLAHRLDTLEHRPLAPVDRRAIATQPDAGGRLAHAARAFARGVEPGDPLGRIRIPSIGVSKVMVEGTDSAQLTSGPGHYPSTPLPGRHGTVAVAGHRTTYGAPFRHIDGVRPGDRVEITMPYGVFTYRAQRTRIVASDAWWITHRVGYDRLVLSACHPLYSATHRIVVFAQLVSAVPRGTAVAGGSQVR
jgi:sortase A